MRGITMTNTQRIYYGLHILLNYTTGSLNNSNGKLFVTTEQVVAEDDMKKLRKLGWNFSGEGWEIYI